MLSFQRKLFPFIFLNWSFKTRSIFFLFEWWYCCNFVSGIVVSFMSFHNFACRKFSFPFRKFNKKVWSQSKRPGLTPPSWCIAYNALESRFRVKVPYHCGKQTVSNLITLAWYEYDTAWPQGIEDICLWSLPWWPMMMKSFTSIIYMYKVKCYTSLLYEYELILVYAIHAEVPLTLALQDCMLCF